MGRTNQRNDQGIPAGTAGKLRGWFLGGSGVTSKWRQIGSLPGHVTRFTVRGLVEGLEYNFRVRSVNEVGVSSACGLGRSVAV